MFRGTTIDELMDLVERAEEHARGQVATPYEARLLPVYNDQAYEPVWQTRDWREMIEVA